ncbi:hypothetical protein [Phenylobacterium montanum]|uniref:Uncharacterized protein n=1 Tax=Phenylobacterium montanum TaxID=2823693 RepID=A0A975FWN4_9CAUL|nr:hypothetical protein [Caulobacter sp. S6]QUD86183.1 hypothetical protein KCG34_13845 [Caulobacter sp. S6]
MFGSQTRTKDLFANRFEPDGDGYLFRANLKAPGVRVTSGERDRFVHEFGRRVTILTWVSAGVTVALVLAAAFYSTGENRSVAEWIIAPIVALCIGGFMGPFYWLWYAPVRALGGRLPATPGRSATEARRVALERLTWKQLGLSALVVPALLFRLTRGHDLLTGWNRLWMAFCGLLLLFIAVQAARKWRATRS